MDVLTLTSEIVRALAWPITVAGIALAFRRSIGDVLRRINRVSWNGLSADIAQDVKNLLTDAQALPPPGKDQKPNPRMQLGVSGPLDLVDRLAVISPRAAVAEAWRAVEQAMITLADTSGGTPPRPSAQRLIEVLRSRGQVTQQVADIIHQLSTIRNTAVHATEADITAATAREYGRVANRVVLALQILPPGG